MKKYTSRYRSRKKSLRKVSFNCTKIKTRKFANEAKVILREKLIVLICIYF